MSAWGVRREKAALSSGCKSHPAIAPAGSSRSSYGGDEIAEAFGKRVTKYGDSAIVQAVTRVNVFVGGVMNVLWFALLALLVLLEKLTPIGLWIARAAGVTCVGAGVWMLLS